MSEGATLTMRQAQALLDLESEIEADDPHAAELHIENEYALGANGIIKVGHGAAQNGYFEQNWLVGRDGGVIKL